jgi:F0F1-type ATP synthase assembly protein I
MRKLKKIGAAIAGLGILAIALYLAAFVFVILLVIGLILGVYIWLKGGKIRAEFERRQGEARGPDQTIEGEYTVVEEEVVDRDHQPRP